jgi:hypothetical protein
MPDCEDHRSCRHPDVNHAVFPPGREGAVCGAAAVGDGDNQLGGADLRGHAELGVGAGQAQAVIQAPLGREAVLGVDGLDAQLRGPQVAGLVGPAAVEPGGDPGALGEQVSAAACPVRRSRSRDILEHLFDIGSQSYCPSWWR